MSLNLIKSTIINNLLANLADAKDACEELKNSSADTNTKNYYLGKIDGYLYAIDAIMNLTSRFDASLYKCCEVYDAGDEETKYVYGSRVPMYQCSGCKRVLYGTPKHYCPACGRRFVFKMPFNHNI